MKINKLLLTILFIVSTLSIFSQSIDKEKYKERYEKAIKRNSIDACEEFVKFYEYVDSSSSDVKLIKDKLIRLYFDKARIQKRQGNFIAAGKTLSYSLRYCYSDKCIQNINKEIRSVNKASYQIKNYYNEIKIAPAFVMNMGSWYDVYQEDMLSIDDKLDFGDDISYGPQLDIGDDLVFMKTKVKKIGLFFEANIRLVSFKEEGMRDIGTKFGLIITSFFNPYIKYNIYHRYSYTIGGDSKAKYFYRQEQKGNLVYGIDFHLTSLGGSEGGNEMYGHYESSNYAGTTTIAQYSASSQGGIEDSELKTNTKYQSYGIGYRFLIDSEKAKIGAYFSMNKYDVYSSVDNVHLYTSKSLFLFIRVNVIIGRQYIK